MAGSHAHQHPRDRKLLGRVVAASPVITGPWLLHADQMHAEPHIIWGLVETHIFRRPPFDDAA